MYSSKFLVLCFYFLTLKILYKNTFAYGLHDNLAVG